MKEKLEKFVHDFLAGMSNERGGHSMKKWLAVGFFWLTCIICIRFTTDSNVTYVIGILTATILALMGINQLGKQSMKKLDGDDEPKDENKSEEKVG
jgi:hypothetical protein